MFKSTDCILILGRRGCGKSFLCKNVQSAYPRTIILDTLHEYSDGMVFSDFNNFGNKLIEIENNKLNKFRIIFRFNPEIENSETIFNQIMYLAYKLGDVQVVLEEIQLYSTPHYLPSWLKQALLTGRHRGMSLLFTTQRPGELNKTILSQCAHIFAGQLHEKNDLNYISSFLGTETINLINLPQRKFIYFRPGESLIQINNDLT